MIYRKFLCFVDNYSGNVRDYLKSQITFLNSRNTSCLLVTMCRGKHAMEDGFDDVLHLPDGSGDFDEKALRYKLRHLRSFAEKHQINIIHSHAVTAFPQAAFLAGQMGLPLVCTSHSDKVFQQGLENGQSKLYNQLQASASINFALSPFILAVYKEMTQGKRGIVLSRPLAAPPKQFSTINPNRLHRWFWAGKINKESLPGLTALIKFAAHIDLGTLDLFGDGDERSALQSHLATMPSKTQITLRGFEPNLAERQMDYGIACGKGRIVLDALSVGLPALLVSDAGLHGFIEEKNVADLAFSNFDGRFGDTITADRLATQLLDLRFEPHRFELMNWVRKHHGDDDVWQAFEGLVDAQAAAPRFDVDRMIQNWASNMRAARGSRSVAQKVADILGRVRNWSSSAGSRGPTIGPRLSLARGDKTPVAADP